MSDPLRAHYDAIPSFHGSIPESHPARLAAIGRLIGFPAASPDRCRVLELGCATGLNLLPLAERLPQSQFVGADLSPVQIEAAESLRAESGLENVQFVCADLRDWEPEAGAFDYVIAHGVYSWVPDEVKDRLLAICARALAPQGIAYVSYNVLPGWSIRGALRQILLRELSGDPIESAQRVLPLLAQSFAQQPGHEASLMRSALAEMQAKTPAALFHDDLAPINDPVTFRQFTDHAGRHGLNWFAEAHFASLPFDHLPLAARQPLQALAADPLQAQQYLDLLGHRGFRNSLLTRGPAPDFNRLQPSVIRQCAVSSRLAPADSRISLAPGQPLQLHGPHGFKMAVEKPEQKAFFAALCQLAPQRVPFEKVLAQATELLKRAGVAQTIDPDLMAHGLLKLYFVDQVDLFFAGDYAWLETSGASAASPLLQALARQDRPLINRWHETVQVAPEHRRWLAGEAVGIDPAPLRRAGLVG